MRLAIPAAVAFVAACGCAPPPAANDSGPPPDDAVAGEADVRDEDGGIDAPDGADGDGDAPWDPASYRVCGEAGPCPPEAECVSGLCVPRCGAGPACLDGEVCRDGGCGEACDGLHPCTQAYSCVDGSCVPDPCGYDEYWPLAIAAPALPILIHFRDEAERSVAEETLGFLEFSWGFETGTLGFEPPLLDRGQCGPDDSFDVFIWRSYEGGDVETLDPEPATAWDDAATYMTLDPWGPYGGDRLDATIAHELNHAMQAVHDWSESAIVFEMTSQFVEDLVYDDDNGYAEYLFDYQQNPDWAFDYDDGYDTFYMYGSALYFFYLRDAVFAGDASFVSDLWRRCRSPADSNEPDFEDALASLLPERAGMGFAASLVEFSRWRWYTSDRDDGRHFEEGGTFPWDSLVPIERRLQARPQTVRVEPGPMMLGANYVELAREPGGPDEIDLRIEGGGGLVRWSVQVVPGLDPDTDGETLDVSAGPATVSLGTSAARTLIVLALPAGPDDPDDRTDERFPYTLTLTSASGMP